MSDGIVPLTAERAQRQGPFGEFRKTVTTKISEALYPPGTVYDTPEGLRAEDEWTRAALDVQGGVYPIRESVFQASYERVEPWPPDGRRCEFGPPSEPWSCITHPGGMRTTLNAGQCRRP